ncbi:MAG: hypothetical protein JNK85_15640 [Verrucomicrobiales bacterium]|nr:hypothetical protein [Verrucomicrobiales bacterium]
MRLRAFVFDRERAVPLSGVVLEAIAEVKASNPGGARKVPAGVLVSDHAGYLSFNLTGVAAKREEVVSLSLRPLMASDSVVDALPYLVDGEDGPILPFPAEALWAIRPSDQGLLPSLQGNSLADWKVSPASFAAVSLVRFGEGKCEEVLPSHEPVALIRFSQILREPVSDPGSLSVHKPAPCEIIMDPKRPAGSSVCYRRGALLEYEMSWRPVGHGLGRVMYSLPLAPCESVNVALLDWSREETKERTESMTSVDSLSHRQLRDRAIRETVQAAIDEWQRGGSLLGGGAISDIGSMLSGVLSLGGGYSTTSGSRDVASETLQRLMDSVDQASTLTRELRSTVVVHASQAESQRAETRTVVNHNRCHAMTVLYYEVVRHFIVSTRLTRKTDVILVKRPLDPFNAAEVLRYRRELLGALLDPTLATAFDDLEAADRARAEAEERPPETSADDRLLTRFWLRILPSAEPVGTNVIITASLVVQNQFGGLSTVPLRLVAEEAGELARLEEKLNALTVAVANLPVQIRNAIRSGDFAASTFSGLGTTSSPDRTNLFQTLESGLPPFRRSSPTDDLREEMFLVEPVLPVRRTAIRSLRIEISSLPGRRHPSPAFDIRSVAAVVTDSGPSWTLYHTPADAPVRAVRRDAPAEFEVTPWVEAPESSAVGLTALQRWRVRQLLNHLNEHKLHYRRALWIAEDSGVRALWLDRFAFSEESGGRTISGRLLDFVENRVVGVIGDYLAVPLAVGHFSDSVPTPRLEPVERRISLPTRGAFAEAKLAHCNACEEYDFTRIPPEPLCDCQSAPAIDPVSVNSSRARDLSADPSVPSSAGVTITPPEAAPPPAGMQAVLEILGKSDIFRDQSAKGEVSAILQKMIEGSVGLETAQRESDTKIKLAEIDKDKTLEAIRKGLATPADSGNPASAASPPTGGGGGSSSSSSRPDAGGEARDGSVSMGSPLRQAHGAMQVLNQLRDTNAITPQQYREAAAALASQLTGGGEPSAVSLRQEIPEAWRLRLASPVNDCPALNHWAVAVSLLMSWREGVVSGREAYTVEQALELLDMTMDHPMFLERYRRGEGILDAPTAREADALLGATSTRARAGVPALIRRVPGLAFGRLPTPVELGQMLHRHGPIWLTSTGRPGALLRNDTADVAGRYTNRFGLSGIIVTGLEGDGQPTGTSIRFRAINDGGGIPIVGRWELFSDKLAELAASVARDGVIDVVVFDRIPGYSS